jgi:hypothetical protein
VKIRQARFVLLGRVYEFVPLMNSGDALANEFERVFDQVFCASAEKLNQLISLTPLKKLADATIGSAPEVQR